jgi:hypothetical protein
MTTVTITYTLPDEQYELTCALEAVATLHALTQAQWAIRNQLKHGDEKKDRQVLEELWSMLSEVVDD